jgi:GntR family transcriptional regulator, transcriptional repressor for pyruvate dehydrogenase complex
LGAMVTETTSIANRLPGRIFFPGRSASLSSQIVADVRDALFAKKYKPGDVLGTENEIAARYGVSRIVARDALRTLEAQGIAEIKMGKGGGARVARGNPRLFAEALAVQLDLTGVGPSEVMDAQRAIECLAAELAAENATNADIERMRRSIADADASMGDAERFTQLGADFHLAVAEASHNRVLVVQLISLQHVSWPRRNPTLTPKVMRRIQDVHKELLGLIEIRDAAGARKMMDDHVKMIRARRVSEHTTRAGKRTKDSAPRVRSAPTTRARNPEPRTEQTAGFRVRSLSRAPRRGGDDDGAGCC